jgi:hypothetical protein
VCDAAHPHRYYFSALNPAAVVSSGDEIVVETATHQAGDDYDKMVRGDPAMEVGLFFPLCMHAPASQPFLTMSCPSSTSCLNSMSPTSSPSSRATS